MTVSSEELLRRRLLHQKISSLPTVKLQGKGEVSKGGREVRESFFFSLQPDLIDGRLILYEDNTAKIVITCYSWGLVPSETDDSDSQILLSGSPFAIPPEDLDANSQYSKEFDGDQSAYRSILNFYKWILEERCGWEEVTYDDQPLSEREIQDVLNHFSNH